jgi:hypothetical protein
MGFELESIAAQTPISDDDKRGLRFPAISTRGELDEFEPLNIEEVLQLLLFRRFGADVNLTEEYVCNLHRRMPDNFWSLAGEFRKTETNIGVDSWQIGVSLRNLLDDIRFRIANAVYPPDEAALRFKHLLVSHPLLSLWEQTSQPLDGRHHHQTDIQKESPRRFNLSAMMQVWDHVSLYLKQRPTHFPLSFHE